MPFYSTTAASFVVPRFRVQFVVVVIVLLPGCAHLHPWATDQAIDGSYTQVFQATLETLENRDFPIEQVDRAGGRIETGKRPVSGVGPPPPVETVRAEITRENDRQARVRLFLTFQGDPPPDASGRSRGDDDSRVEEAVGRALDRSAVYDGYLDAIEARVREYQTGGDP